MTTETDTHAERALDGIWFLDTFLCFGFGQADPANPFKVENVSYVEVTDAEGFSEVNVTLESGDTYHVTVEKVTA